MFLSIYAHTNLPPLAGSGSVMIAEVRILFLNSLAGIKIPPIFMVYFNFA
jgi:hypothetical protein